MSPKHPKLMSNRNRTNMLQIKYLIHDVEVAEQSDVLELRTKVVIVVMLYSCLDSTLTTNAPCVRFFFRRLLVSFIHHVSHWGRSSCIPSMESSLILHDRHH